MPPHTRRIAAPSGSSPSNHGRSAQQSMGKDKSKKPRKMCPECGQDGWHKELYEPEDDDAYYYYWCDLCRYSLKKYVKSLLSGRRH